MQRGETIEVEVRNPEGKFRLDPLPFFCEDPASDGGCHESVQVWLRASCLVGK